MSLRFGPFTRNAYNLFYQGNMIINDANASFILDAVDQAAKITLLADYIERLFALTTTPTLTMSVVTKGQEWYQFDTDYYIFIRN